MNVCYYQSEYKLTNCTHVQGMSYEKGMESANNDARKWPILPFDVSRDFIIRLVLVYCNRNYSAILATLLTILLHNKNKN